MYDNVGKTRRERQEGCVFGIGMKGERRLNSLSRIVGPQLIMPTTEKPEI